MIKVDDGYYIKTDGNGLVAIKTMVAKKSGNENAKVIGYYTTFENALKGIEDQMVLDYVESTKTEDILVSDAILKKREIRNKMKRIRRELEDEEL